jgi:aerotaxis receptor
MRINLPVLDKEYPFPEGESLVSTTDLKGRITHCNRAFIAVSGYTSEELLGQPHNMIRHPDMPEEAFRDMWSTISSGSPWSALVKNRRKDGTFYWVMANVTPLMEGDQAIGYMSVRTKPSRASVAQAEALYAQMRQEHSQGKLVHRLHRGHLYQDDLPGKLKKIMRMGLSAQIVATTLTCTLAGLLVGLLSVDSGGQWSLPKILMGLAALASLALAGGALIHRRLIRPLHEMLSFANRMAAGDLTSQLQNNRSDVIGQFSQALQQLNVNLGSIVKDARNEVEQMLVATQEIAEGNLDLSSRTESQAGSLEQTAASMEQITGTVKTSSDTASQAASLAQAATAITSKSSDAVHEVTKTMKGIQDSSQRISEIIHVIDSIAFQTNILALNAAVEAARAGEQGRGFAVVAAEVRALAGRTATAAKEVKQLISDSAEKIATGSKLTEAAQNTMEEAKTSVQQVSVLVESISHGSHEQLMGISQINSAVAHLDTITQQNAAAVEQISAASMSLASQARVVSDTVQVFRLDQKDHVKTVNAVDLRRSMKHLTTAVDH